MTVSVSSAVMNHCVVCLNNCKMKRSKQRTLFEFDVLRKRRNGKARIPSLLVVRMSNVAISDEMAPRRGFKGGGGVTGPNRRTPPPP